MILVAEAYLECGEHGIINGPCLVNDVADEVLVALLDDGLVAGIADLPEDPFGVCPEESPRNSHAYEFRQDAIARNHLVYVAPDLPSLFLVCKAASEAEGAPLIPGVHGSVPFPHDVCAVRPEPSLAHHVDVVCRFLAPPHILVDAVVGQYLPSMTCGSGGEVVIVIPLPLPGVLHLESPSAVRTNDLSVSGDGNCIVSE